MCLTLKKPDIKTKEVYKIYAVDKREMCAYDTKTVFSYDLKSPHKIGYSYENIRIGSVITSNRLEQGYTRKLSSGEKKYGSINYGLHVFTRVEDAISNAAKLGKRCVVVRLTGKATELVAEGVWDYDGQWDGAVYNELTVSKFVEEFDKRGKRTILQS